MEDFHETSNDNSHPSGSRVDFPSYLPSGRIGEKFDGCVGEVRAAAIAEADKYRGRLTAVAGPDGELLSYLPSRVVEGGESGVSQQRAEALCRRLVAVHCLYGVDMNPLAVELAKLSLWIESHAYTGSQVKTSPERTSG